MSYRGTKMGRLLQKILHPEIYYGFSSEHNPNSSEHSSKNLRKARNQRYYRKHLAEIRQKRKEYYDLMGK